MTNLTLPVSDFLAASGERWPIMEAMTLSEEDRAALRDQVKYLRDLAHIKHHEAQLDFAKATNRHARAMEYAKGRLALAARLQSKLDSAQVTP